MKNIKRLTALILSILMCIPNITSFASSYEDVNDGKLSEAIDLFEDLGLISGYEDGYFRQEQGMIRADFAIMLAGLMGYTGEREYTVQHFTDVDSSSPAYGSIEFLFEEGLINGTSNGVFSPDEPILYSQAVKIVMSALGYEIYAQAKGGYPSGYLSAASAAGVLSNVGGSEVLSRGSACILLYNALTAPIMGYGMSDESITYAPDSSNTLLYDVLKITKMEGLFIADKSLSVYGDYNLANGDIIIDYTRYKTTLSNLSDYVGRYVTYYVNENEEVISICDKSEEVIEVSGEDVDPSSTPDRIYYDNGKRIENYPVASDAYYVYNGRALPTITADNFKDIYGSLTIINNDADEEAEVVIIWNYQNYVVENYVSLTETIHTKTAGVSFDLSSKEYSITKNGADITPADVIKNNIITVTETDEIINIIVSDTVVSGKLTGFSEEDNTFTITGTTYEVASGCRSDYEMGATYDFYLDAFGRVAYFEISDSSNTAYLFNSYIDTDISDDAAFSKLFNIKGEFVTVEYADRVTVQTGPETKVYEPADLINQVLKPGGVVFDGLVQYELNANGEVVKLKMPMDADFEDWGSDYFVCNMDTAKMVAEGKLKVESSNMYNSKLSWVNGNTEDRQYTLTMNGVTVFNITKSQDTWSIKSYGNYANGAKFINAKVYNITAKGEAKYILVYSDQVGADSDSFDQADPVVAITDKLVTINDDDEICYTINTMNGAGEEAMYYVQDGELESSSPLSMQKNIKFSELQRGDVIQVKVDNYGNVSSFRLMCKASGNPEHYYNPYNGTPVFALAPISHGNAYFGPSEVVEGTFIYKNSQEAIDTYLAGGSEYPVATVKHAVGGGCVVFDRKTKDCTYLPGEEAYGTDETFIYTYPGYGKLLIVVYQ